MSDRATVSVCMATYNGARFIREQLESILVQLEPQDEIVIVDDASTDDTLRRIASLDSSQIVVHPNASNLGYVRSFERAITLARGEVILLSDQDDVWIQGRVDVLVEATTDHGVAASNLVLLESGSPLSSPLTGRPWRLNATASSHSLRNELRILIGDAPYFGCAMAVRRRALASILPFPTYLTESHDLWIATVANAAGELTHVERATIRRRVHDDNASTSRPRGFRKALRSRLLLVQLWREARRRARQR